MPNGLSIVFANGGWHSAGVWDKLRSELGSVYIYTVVDYPTMAGDPTKHFGDNVRAVSDACKEQIAKGNNVVILMHSYGGLPGQSGIKGLTAKDDSDMPPDTTASVIGLININSGYAQPDAVLVDLFGGKPLPFRDLRVDGFSSCAIDYSAVRELFYGDLSLEEGEDWVRKLRKQSSRAFTDG